jgi:putative tryptophan/tyrosine transport system substrate-binding protein
MRRRDVLALLGGTLVLLPAAVRVQQKAMPVIGYLSYFEYHPESPALAAFRAGLAEAGLIEGQNVAIEYHAADAHVGRLPALASDLVAHQVDVIVTTGGQAAARAAKEATSDIPIVFMTGADPVDGGLVANLAHPGGNLTGVTFISSELNLKRFELLSELVPAAKLVALLASGKSTLIQDMQQAADKKAIRLLVVEAHNKDEIDPAFRKIAQLHADALLVGDSALFTLRRWEVIALASRYAIPTIYHWREFTAAGGLLSYGASAAVANRQVGVYAGKILAGAKPADLPVQQPTKFELVINLKTARALGLTVPQSLLARADEVIE